MSEHEGESKTLTAFMMGFVVACVLCLGVGGGLAWTMSRRTMLEAERARMMEMRARDEAEAARQAAEERRAATEAALRREKEAKKAVEMIKK